MHDCLWAIEKERKHTSGCTKLTFQKIGWREGGVLFRFELLLKRIAEYLYARNAAWVTLGDLGYDCAKNA
jgi:hypothetical protein